MRVVSRRNDDEIRLKPSRRRFDDEIERLQNGFLARPSRKRYVYIRPFAFVLPDIGYLPRPRETSVFVRGYEQNRRILGENIVRAVSVVNVKVVYQNFFNIVRVLGLRVSHRRSRGVEQTKSHRTFYYGVVPWGADQSEAGFRLAF